MKIPVTPGSVLLAALLLAQTAASGASTPRPGIDWPQFRGIRAAGIDERHPAPVTWDVGKNQAVRWKTPIPGLGHSSPVVWGDTVYRRDVDQRPEGRRHQGRLLRRHRSR